MKALHINGNDLSTDELREVVLERRAVLLDPDARERVERSRAVVEELLDGESVAYAINTGVGKLSDVRIAPEQIAALQVNLLRSHAAGVGEPLSEAETRAMMLLRANSLAKGFSGVRPAVIDTLCEMLNRGVHPVVPSRGSVGASGDLAPLAHLGLVLIGEGEAHFHENPAAGHELRTATRRSGREALSRAGIQPLTLAAKEAISLINGTQAMLAVGVLALLEAETLADSADVVGALSLDALRGTDVAFDERIHRARPHAGQLRSAENVRRMLEGSQIRDSHRDCARVQDAYSLRCIPQVHGAVRDTLAWCRQVFETEMNSAVDNPLVFPAAAERAASAAGVAARPGTAAQPGTAAPHETSGEVLSGGNFHGEPLAFALDFLGIALAALAGISERRVERLVNPALNEGLPPFLAPAAGLNSGLMMAQVTAAALVSENKVLAHPASVDSITTSGNKEDYVSMGMTAALKLRQILGNTRAVLAIEAINAAQALDFLAPLKTSARGQRACAAIRAACPAIGQDRALAGDFERVAQTIAEGKLATALE
ncbi:MAG: histidine ammonia-lyase [Acidobacteria bacterium]|nr:histidine ammonia-lyase [Acidobacteriota bacterium]